MFSRVFQPSLLLFKAKCTFGLTKPMAKAPTGTPCRQRLARGLSHSEAASSLMKDKVHLRDCEELYSAPSLAGDELQPACTVPPLGSGMCHSSPCAPSQAALLPQPLLPTHPPRAPGAYLPTYPASPSPEAGGGALRARVGTAVPSPSGSRLLRRPTPFP